MYVTVTVTVADHTYTALTRPVFTEDGEYLEIGIARDRIWSGIGYWDDAIICPLGLGNNVYDALDEALRAVLA